MDAEFLAAVIDRVGEPVFVKDAQGRFVLVNDALCRMLGHSREQLLGKTDHDVFPPEEAEWFRAVDAQVMLTGRQRVIEGEPITDAAGRRRLLATTKMPLAGLGGESTHLVGIIHDITEREAAEEALRRANEELERRVAERTAALEAAQLELVRKERLAVLGQLAGGIAHQIRNPLGTIANAASLLKRGLSRCCADLSPQLEIILEEVFRANRTINALLDYARVRPPRLEPVPVTALFEQVLAACQPPPDVALSRELPPLELSADVDQIREALINLVQNAIEAMPEGGTLGLRAHLDGDQVVLAIEDSGAGIARELRSRLFQPLVTNKPLGLGLGLTTARNLVENQGGTLQVACGRGSWACFEVRLPAARAPGPSAPPCAPGEQARLEGVRGGESGRTQP